MQKTTKIRNLNSPAFNCFFGEVGDAGTVRLLSKTSPLENGGRCDISIDEEMFDFDSRMVVTVKCSAGSETFTSTAKLTLIGAGDDGHVVMDDADAKSKKELARRLAVRAARLWRNSKVFDGTITEDDFDSALVVKLCEC